jgi:hypothetical protein
MLTSTLHCCRQTPLLQPEDGHRRGDEEWPPCDINFSIILQTVYSHDDTCRKSRIPISFSFIFNTWCAFQNFTEPEGTIRECTLLDVAGNCDMTMSKIILFSAENEKSGPRSSHIFHTSKSSFQSFNCRKCTVTAAVQNSLLMICPLTKTHSVCRRDYKFQYETCQWQFNIAVVITFHLL